MGNQQHPSVTSVYDRLASLRSIAIEQENPNMSLGPFAIRLLDEQLQQIIANTGKLCLAGEVYYCDETTEEPLLTTKLVDTVAPIVSEVHIVHRPAPNAHQGRILHVGTIEQPNGEPRRIGGRITQSKIHVPDVILANIASEIISERGPNIGLLIQDKLRGEPITQQIAEQIIPITHDTLQMNTMMVDNIIKSLPTVQMRQFYTEHLNRVLQLSQFEVKISHINSPASMTIDAQEFTYAISKLTGCSAPCITRTIDDHGTTQLIELSTIISATFTQKSMPSQG
ncbi:hypothetical protein KC867_00470 [Candidatus Saccharibacteria bacterium]|nr:hypothetical protein [Candidatus Saccharibacteria bacterium]